MSPAALRVCLVGPTLDYLGGQAVQLGRLRTALERHPDVAVSFLPTNPRLPGPLRVLQQVKYVRTLATSVAYWCLLLVRLPRVDVVHVFSPSYWAYLLGPLPAILLSRITGRRVILNYHSGEADDHLRRWGWWATGSMQLAHAIVVPSGYLVEVFARFGLSATAIPNAIDQDAITRRDREPGGQVVLTNRNFEAHYDVQTVLRAWALVQRQLPAARLLVAGDGPLRDTLRALAASLALSQVEFLGPVPPTRMGQLYAEADAYVNGSIIDNQPLSLIEAFAAGLPVVSTRTGGIPWIVTDDQTGLLTPPGDADALAAALVRVLTEPGLGPRLAVAARAEFEREYVTSAVTPRWVECYQRVAA